MRGHCKQHGRLLTAIAPSAKNRGPTRTQYRPGRDQDAVRNRDHRCGPARRQLRGRRSSCGRRRQRSRSPDPGALWSSWSTSGYHDGNDNHQSFGCYGNLRHLSRLDALRKAMAAPKLLSRLRKGPVKTKSRASFPPFARFGLAVVYLTKI